MGEENIVVKGFKGFTKDFKCRDKQYAPGTTFEEDGDIKICEHGLHFCKYPLNVFSYYEPGLLSRYCEVSTDCASPETHNDDSKRVTRKLSIGVEIGIPGIVQAAVNYVLERVTSEKTEPNTGYQSAATNTGDQSAATNTGDQSAATVGGEDSVAVATGFEGRAKGSLGCAICCVERDKDDGHIIAIKAAIVDGETVKADTWYVVKAGEFVEA